MTTFGHIYVFERVASLLLEVGCGFVSADNLTNIILGLVVVKLIAQLIAFVHLIQSLVSDSLGYA